MQIGWLFGVAIALLASAAHAAPHPDLSGIWTNSSLTNLQRPRGVDKLVMSETEAQALAARNPNVAGAAEDAKPIDTSAKLTGFDRGYNAFWLDPGSTLAKVKGERRTSWIVEPADGQLPLTEKAAAELRRAANRPGAPPDGPEALAPADRCLIGSRGSGGPGMLNNIYNNTYAFVLTADHLSIEIEMMHDVRIIPILGSAAEARAHHASAVLHPWLGDSVGWWEGHTLVVETTNMNGQTGARGNGNNFPMTTALRLVERFTRTAADTLEYEVSIDDPQTFTRPWKVAYPLKLDPGYQIFEYACHEGNYGLQNILTAERAKE